MSKHESPKHDQAHEQKSKEHAPHALHEDHLKGPHDPKEINPKLASDIAYWSQESGVSGKLPDAIHSHGTHVEKGPRRLPLPQNRLSPTRQQQSPMAAAPDLNTDRRLPHPGQTPPAVRNSTQHQVPRRNGVTGSNQSSPHPASFGPAPASCRAPNPVKPPGLCKTHKTRANTGESRQRNFAHLPPPIS